MIPESLREHYRQTENGYILDVEKSDGYELADTGGLMRALQAERENNRRNKESLKLFDGLDAQAAREALAKMEEWGDLNPNEKAEELFKAKEAQLKKLFAKDKTDWETERSGLKQALEGTMIDAVATQEVAKLDGNIKLLLPHIRSQMRVRQTEGGQYVTEVVDNQGNARMRDANGSMMTIGDLVSEMKGSDDFAMAFKAIDASGSGSRKSDAGNNISAPGVVSASTLDSLTADQIADIAAGKLSVE